jgi:hypothetical protein
MGRYSPPQVVGVETKVISGNPDPRFINTSYAERQNLTMRMQMRRFTRLTNAFSKKISNHCHALALYFVWYNWVKLHKAHRVTPTMAAGLTDKLLSWREILEMVDLNEQHQVYAATCGSIRKTNLNFEIETRHLNWRVR